MNPTKPSYNPFFPFGNRWEVHKTGPLWDEEPVQWEWPKTKQTSNGSGFFVEKPENSKINNVFFLYCKSDLFSREPNKIKSREYIGSIFELKNDKLTNDIRYCLEMAVVKVPKNTISTWDAERIATTIDPSKPIKPREFLTSLISNTNRLQQPAQPPQAPSSSPEQENPPPVEEMVHVCVFTSKPLLKKKWFQFNDQFGENETFGILISNQDEQPDVHLEDSKYQLIRDLNTNELYLNESKLTIRIKSLALSIFSFPFHLIAMTVNSIYRIISLITFYHFWTSKSEPDSTFKTRCREQFYDFLRIVLAPLTLIGLQCSAIYGVVSPHNGRKLYAFFERAVYGRGVLAPCFQPEPTKHLFGGDLKDRGAW